MRSPFFVPKNDDELNEFIASVNAAYSKYFSVNISASKSNKLRDCICEAIGFKNGAYQELISAWPKSIEKDESEEIGKFDCLTLNSTVVGYIDSVFLFNKLAPYLEQHFPRSPFRNDVANTRINDLASWMWSQNTDDNRVGGHHLYNGDVLIGLIPRADVRDFLQWVIFAMRERDGLGLNGAVQRATFYQNGKSSGFVIPFQTLEIKNNQWCTLDMDGESTVNIRYFEWGGHSGECNGVYFDFVDFYAPKFAHVDS